MPGEQPLIQARIALRPQGKYFIRAVHHGKLIRGSLRADERSN